MLFVWSALVMSPRWLALLEPYILWQSIGHDKEPMFFWGPSHGPGVAKKLVFSFADLEPDGCLVADQLKVHAKHLKSRVQINKRGCIRAGWWPCKKTIFFLRWTDVFYWQGPFNGCHYLNLANNADTMCISHDFQWCHKFWYIARLSKKSKNGDFTNFACSKINNLQAPNLQI